MRITLLLILLSASLSGAAQTVGNFKINSSISYNPLKVQFTVFKEDSVVMNLYDNWGKILLTIVPKDVYKPGTYIVEYSISQHFVSDIYTYSFKADSSARIWGSILFIDFKETGKNSDFVKWSYIDTIKVADTTKIVIIDTVNCRKLETSLQDYSVFDASENVFFEDILSLSLAGADQLDLYDLSGKLIRRIPIASDQVAMPHCENGSYIGLFYREGELIRSLKLIKK